MKKLLLLFLTMGILLATENKQPEYGIRFGDKPIRKIKNKKTIEWYLANILKTEQEQLKVQKKILTILQEQFDPQPKEVVINGKKCIANSSADCFVFPITPEAKRIPVLKNMLEKRDKKSIMAYLKWQAKYFRELFKLGNGFQFVIAQYGTKAYPLAYNTIGNETPEGYSVVLMDKMKKYLLSKNASKFELFILYGINKDADLINFIDAIKLVKTIPNLKVNIVFKDKEEYRSFIQMSNIFANSQLLKNRIKIYLNKDFFKKLKIYTTPTFAMFINKEKKFEIVGIGAISADDLISKMIDMLEYKNIISPKEFTGYNMWQKVGNRAKAFYKQRYDIDINKKSKKDIKGM